VLLGLSSLFGVMCGLILVYTIDLPQMDDLVRYRPNTTTELLDIHGREIGSFALERRVVASVRGISTRAAAGAESRLRTRPSSATGA